MDSVIPLESQALFYCSSTSGYLIEPNAYICEGTASVLKYDAPQDSLSSQTFLYTLYTKPRCSIVSGCIFRYRMYADDNQLYKTLFFI